MISCRRAGGGKGSRQEEKESLDSSATRQPPTTMLDRSVCGVVGCRFNRSRATPMMLMQS